MKQILIALLLLGLTALTSQAQHLNTWTGTTSTDWNTATNWSTNGVPSLGANVVIPNVLNDPQINAGTAAIASSVSVQEGAVLTILNSASLSINGATSANAFFNSGTVRNSGQLIMGNAPSNTFFLEGNGLHNSGIFTNNVDGVIHINDVHATALFNSNGTFTNAGSIVIGAESKSTVGGRGIVNMATFSNQAGGAIQIDVSDTMGLQGLVNESSGTFTNAGSLIIGATRSAGSSGLLNISTFTNTVGGVIHVDRATDACLANVGGNFNNAGNIVIGAIDSGGGLGLMNLFSFTNSGCGSLSLFATFSNSGNSASFIQQGLMTVNTTQPHINNAHNYYGVINGITNEGVIAYPQGNPIPNVTNNKLIALPISTTCGLASPALQIGPGNNLTVGTTWYQNADLTTTAGSYNPNSNSFTATNPAPAGATPIYFAVTDPSNSCTRTISVPVGPVQASISLNSAVLSCANPSATLMASTGDSYLWSTGAITASISVTVAGAYSVTVTTGGCTATASTNVTSSSPAPSASITLSSTVLSCASPSATLTASTGDSYLWSTGATTASIDATAAGPYSVTVTTSGGCKSIASASVTGSSAGPSASINPSSAVLSCANPTATLTASTGDSYLWSTGATTASISVSLPDTYSVTVTSAGGCTTVASATVSEDKTPPTAPVLSGASALVNTSAMPLSLTGFVLADANNTLSFYASSGLLNPPTANITTAGVQTFSAVQTNLTGCASPATVFSLTVVNSTSTQPPLNQTVCRNSRVVLTVFVPGAASYHWFETRQSANAQMKDKAGVQLGTATNSLTLVSAQNTSNYFCRVTLSNGSVQWLGQYNVTVNKKCSGRLGVEAEETLQVRLFPNPVADVLQLEVNGLSQPAQVRLYDIQGRTKGQWSLVPQAGQGTLKADVSTLGEGLYIVEVETLEGVLHRQRVLKQR